MRGKLAKRIRRHVRERYPFLSLRPLYMRRESGTIILAQQCQRAITQKMKKAYKKRRYYGTLGKTASSG